MELINGLADETFNAKILKTISNKVKNINIVTDNKDFLNQLILAAEAGKNYYDVPYLSKELAFWLLDKGFRIYYRIPESVLKFEICW